MKPSTLVRCFQRSQVKVYGPAPIAVDSDVAEVEEEIYKCIRVAYPAFQRARLPEFINSVDEVVEDSVEEEEQRIFDTYQPTPLQESDSDVDDVPSISYKVALEALKTYVSSGLNIPISIHRKASSWSQSYIKRSGIHIETLQGIARRAQHHSAITGC